jgi:hypothetical protein
MCRGIGLIVWIGLLVFTGCCNHKGASPFGTTARVPAPATYQLRIPSLASNQPNNASGQGQQMAASPNINPPALQVNPIASAPTQSAGTTNVNGWNLVNGPAMQASNAPVYQTPYSPQTNLGVPSSNLQVAVASTLPNPSSTSSSSTFASQPNSMLNQPDSTRLAAIDVSVVRPPTAVTPPINPSSASSIQGQSASTQPQQYLGHFQTSGGINQPNSSGFVQPALPTGSTNPTSGGAPGTYQSPFIRTTGSLTPGVDPRTTGSVGWVQREGEPSANR